MADARLLQGDALEMLKTLDSGSVQTCVTSPPYYGLRDYGVTGQIGLEVTPEEYIARLVAVFSEVRRVLKDDGTLWVNIGDSYAGAGGMGSFVVNKAAKGMKIIKDYARGDVKQMNIARSKRNASRWGGGNLPANGDLKPKDLIGIPWMLAFALRADGWYLRQDIIWAKPNPMPESVTDRCTKSHEYVFLLAKSQRYYYDAEAIKETVSETNGRMKVVGQAYSFARKVNEEQVPGQPKQHRTDREDIEYRGSRNRRSVWTVTTKPYREAHFATFPPDLIEPCILAGSRVGDTVLDPFNGSGTTGVVSLKYDRNYVGIELKAEYMRLTRRRLALVQPFLMGVEHA